MKQKIQDISRENIEKTISILLYINIIIIIYVIYITPPAFEYEISIYGAYPSYFWIIFIFNIILGISITIFSIVRGNAMWIFSSMATLLENLIIIFLPVLRGYEFYASGGADVFFHLAKSLEIINSGQMPATDHYPIIHIIVAIFNFLGFNDPLITITIITSLFYLLFIAALFILGTTIFKEKRVGALFIMCGFPLFFSFGYFAFYPYLFGVLLIPLILHLIHQILNVNLQKRYIILLLILSIFVILCHPMVAVFLTIILSTMYGYTRFISKTSSSNQHSKYLLLAVALVVVLALCWYLSFSGLLWMIENALNSLFHGRSKTILEHNVAMVCSGASLVHIAEKFIFVYGPMALILAISVVVTIASYKGWISLNNNSKLLYYGLLQIVSMAVGIVLLTGYFIIFEVMRAISFAVIIAIIQFGIGAGLFITRGNSQKRNKIFAIGMILVLSFTSAVPVFNVYNSPWNLMPGAHIGEKDLSGTDWFLNANDPANPIYSSVGSIYQYVGYYQQLHMVDVEEPTVIVGGLPTHFGYERYNTLGQSLNNSDYIISYMITNELMKQQHLARLEEMRPFHEQFLEEDFLTLHSDISVNKIYSNGGTDFWQITKMM